ncbi:MAG: aminotransferase class I/II-fold pyridoxal phosphate-dependent enzyme, partial [Bacteroidota bacterium]
DSMAHPSITDGIPGSISRVNFYDHCNTDHLEDLLKKLKKHRPLIITDGIFALTGEIAPLDEIYMLAQKYNAILVVDDAHASGVLGKNGRGTPEHFNLDGSANLYQSETMSKAFGAYGGFIAAKREIINEIRLKSTFYGASTALPPPIVAAGCSSVQLVRNHPELREKLKDNIRLVKNGIRQLDCPITDDLTPIIPVVFRDKQTALALSGFLEENRIIAPCIDYPVKMNKFTVRITVSASHTKEQIENLMRVLKKWQDRKNSAY